MFSEHSQSKTFMSGKFNNGRPIFDCNSNKRINMLDNNNRNKEKQEVDKRKREREKEEREKEETEGRGKEGKKRKDG